MYMKGSDELFSWRHIQVQSALKEMGGQLISSTLPSYSPQQFGIKNKPETQQQMNWNNFTRIIVTVTNLYFTTYFTQCHSPWIIFTVCKQPLQPLVQQNAHLYSHL